MEEDEKKLGEALLEVKGPQMCMGANVKEEGVKRGEMRREGLKSLVKRRPLESVVGRIKEYESEEIEILGGMSSRGWCHDDVGVALAVGRNDPEDFVQTVAADVVDVVDEGIVFVLGLGLVHVRAALSPIL